MRILWGTSGGPYEDPLRIVRGSCENTLGTLRGSYDDPMRIIREASETTLRVL